ncbi:hypothetical protein C8F04DRAFT_1141707 [Mycena alexandri]|uniref:F-box domain-containing protein n=1 Tax=Mycena alexandri TaxID=1745969 RepID=A0AAD6WRR9_9AGAR|nr:hypothetical protein C8F04DRAFT_1141707 [Mycena alexandri]
MKTLSPDYAGVTESPERVTPSERDSLAADRSRIAEIEATIRVEAPAQDPLEGHGYPVPTVPPEIISEIYALQREKDSAQTRLDAYTYPVLTLPPEIIAEVFLRFLPVYPKLPPVGGLFSPFTLGQICRTWREIALSTPRLWRAVDMSPSSTSTLKQQLHLTKLTLARSGSCLLSISIKATEGQTPSIVEVLAPHCGRWEHLKLGVPALSQLHRHSLPLPSLRSLTVPRALRGYPENDGPNAFVAAPLLHKVVLNEYFTPWGSILPWSQLSVFVVDYILLEHCASVLSLAPNLVFCSFKVSSIGRSQNFVPSSCQFLETLVLRTGFQNWRDVAGLLNSLTFPALRELQVAEIFLMPNPVAALGELLSRSGCRPSKICIMDGERPLKRYREAWPSIEFYEARQPARSADVVDIEDAEELEWENGHSRGGELPREDSDPSS